MCENHKLELGLPAKPDLATCFETASAPSIYIFYIQEMADPFQGRKALSSPVVYDALAQCLLSPAATSTHHKEEEVLNVFFFLFVFAICL